MFATEESVAAKRRVADAAEADFLREVADYDHSGNWSLNGSMSAAASVRRGCRMDPGVAAHAVDLARKLIKMPDVLAAFLDGDVSLRHVEVLARAHTAKRTPILSRAEPELVAAARDHSPNEFGAIVRGATDSIDGDGGAERDQDDFDARKLYASKTLHGRGDLHGTCDPLSFDIVEQALNAEMVRDLQASDPRTKPARRMDALTNMCRRALNQGELGESHGVQPHVTLVVDLDELPSGTPDDVVHIRSDLRHHGYSANMLELLLCDCDISRVIVAGKSEILDLGRSTDIASPAQWKALVVRDRHCQAPGCTRPPAECQAHHIDYWTRGGCTDLDNLQLLCWYHHRQRHTHDARDRAANRRTPTYEREYRHRQSKGPRPRIPDRQRV